MRALVRDRLDEKLLGIWDHRLGLVVGQAGSGKTTLLADFAGRSGVPVAWYRAEASDSTTESVLEHLSKALNPAIGPLSGPWSEIEDSIYAVEGWKGERALLVIDDLHALLGTQAERALEKFIMNMPSNLRILAASRRPPSINISRLRVSGDLLELSPDDLRFRSWEVEQLFRYFYREPLPPEDLAELTRRTEGWAAGLQLFHLSTRGKPAGERRRAVAALGRRWKLVGEYLARNVLEDLPSELRSFLLETCVLGRLTGSSCDELLGAQGSRQVLEELEERQIFTYALDDEGTYRYHEALRSHLESMLVESLGEPETRRRHLRAGELLERAGILTDAVHSYSRAEAWDRVARLTVKSGEHLADGPASWIRSMPPSLLDQDPWLKLAEARHHLASGNLASAVDTYRKVEAAFGSTAGADISRTERRAVTAWVEPNPERTTHWTGLIRAATKKDPLLVAQEASGLKGATSRLAEGVALMLAGHMRRAQTRLEDAAEDPEAGEVTVTAARGALLMVILLREHGGSAQAVEQLAGQADRLGIPSLARLSRSLLGLTDREGAAKEAATAREASERSGDRWGAALASFLQGAAELRSGGTPIHELQSAVDEFRSLGAGVLEAWAQSLLAWAMVRNRHIEAHASALVAEARARSVGAQAPQMLACAVLATLDQHNRQEYLTQAIAIGEQCQIDLVQMISRYGASEGASLSPNGSVNANQDRPPSTLSVRCFGGFSVSVDGQPLDLLRVKPRARTALRLLGMHSGRPIHRETLIEALWPSGNDEAGTRNLHVAISSLRQLLEPGVPRGTSTFLVREGDAYRLAVPEAGECDVLAFEEAFSAARSARSAKDLGNAVTWFERALDLYTGDLLPEDGPAEWVIVSRERYRAEAAECALLLSELHLELGRPDLASAASEKGIRIDRYRDELWRVAFEAYESAGDQASAARARREYRSVLNELGVAPVTGA